MTSEKFANLLSASISGSEAAIEKIIELYAPLINSNSILYGKQDEDLRQYIILHIIKNISKFKIE